MKRLVLFVLTLSLLQLALAQLAPLPDDSRFDAPVTLETQLDGLPLRSIVSALAKSVGLTAVVNDVPDKSGMYDIANGKPFRQVWNVVLTLNNLDYVLLDNDMIVVGTAEAVTKLRAPQQVSLQNAEAIEQRFYKVSGDVGAITTFIRQELPNVSANTFDSLGVLSIQAGQSQHEQVAAILGEIGRASQTVPLEQRVYNLANARADELAVILQTSGITATLETADAEGGSRTREEKEFIVVAEPRTNSLVVTAPAAVQSRIADLIPQLDRAIPQINVQVRIQEVSTTAAQRLGVNLNAGIGSFAATILDSGLRFIFDAQSAMTGLNVGAVLDTLERQGLSRRVDDSNLTLLNNSTGEIKSGGRIEITFPGRDGEITTRTIEFGVIISVTPQISDDGRVILMINAEVSDPAVPLGQGIPERIDFIERKVSSTITLQPGQTVVLGGLLQHKLDETVQGVPILSSLPLIGGLFSTTTIEERNTEMLLIVNAIVLE